MCVIDLIFIVISRTLREVTNLFKHKTCAHFPTSAMGASLPSDTSLHHLSSLPYTSHDDHNVIELVNLPFPLFESLLPPLSRFLGPRFALGFQWVSLLWPHLSSPFVSWSLHLHTHGSAALH